MELHEGQVIALVNLLGDSLVPDPDDSGPIGPWGPWIKDALRQSPVPDPWRPDAGVAGAWWHDYHPGPPPYWRTALEMLANAAWQVDDHNGRWGRPRPNWFLGALLRDLASLNPQPLPPVDPGVIFARSLSSVAMQRAGQAGGEQGGRMLRRFSDDWCGTMRIPLPKKPGDPGEPRPPRPQESLVLGAALVRAGGRSDDAALKSAAQEAGRRIFQHGFASVT